jgi:hypothetical protein
MTNNHKFISCSNSLFLYLFNINLFATIYYILVCTKGLSLRTLVLVT